MNGVKKSIVALFELLKTPYPYWGSLIMNFLEKFLFDSVFLINIAVLISLDTILGVFLAWKEKRVKSSSFGNLFSKIAIYFIVLSAMHNTADILHAKKLSFFADFLDSTLYSAICIRELLSILEKVILLGYLKINLKVFQHLEVYYEWLKKIQKKD